MMSYVAMKKAALASLLSFTVSSTVLGWGNPSEVSVGYPVNQNPTPPSADCLNAQEVFGKSETIFYGTAVEPKIAVNPSDKQNLITCWSQDRIGDTGALEVGIAYTKDGGKTWTRTTLPMQIASGGLSQRVTDSWICFSPTGKRAFLFSIFTNATIVPLNQCMQSGIAVSISEDGGVNWTYPRPITFSGRYLNEPTLQYPRDEKLSVVVDPNDSRFVYAIWDRYRNSATLHSAAYVSVSPDLGHRWSAQKAFYDPFLDLEATRLSNGIINHTRTVANSAVVLPFSEPKDRLWKYDVYGNDQNKAQRFSGDLLSFMCRIYAKPNIKDDQYRQDAFPFKAQNADIAVVRSKDHGNTWETQSTIIARVSLNSRVYTGGYTYDNQGNISGGAGYQIRTGTDMADIWPSYAVNSSNGFLYVVWQTSQFRKDQLPQVAIATSRDGGYSWSKPALASRTPTNAKNAQAFSPTVAVTQNGYVGIVYNDFRFDDKSDPNSTKTDTWIAIYKEIADPFGGSTGTGLEFVREERLSQSSFIVQNGPSNASGVLTYGPFSSLTADAGNFYVAYTKALNGPFVLASKYFKNATNKSELLLDLNNRTAPYFSVIKP